MTPYVGVGRQISCDWRYDDVRWKYGIPPDGNANFSWLQHKVHHLAPNGIMALLMANGSRSSNTNNEGEIRRALIEGNDPNAPGDLVECIVALPGQLFTNNRHPERPVRRERPPGSGNPPEPGGPGLPAENARLKRWAYASAVQRV